MFKKEAFYSSGTQHGSRVTVGPKMWVRGADRGFGVRGCGGVPGQQNRKNILKNTKTDELTRKIEKSKIHTQVRLKNTSKI